MFARCFFDRSLENTVNFTCLQMNQPFWNFIEDSGNISVVNSFIHPQLRLVVT